MRTSELDRDFSRQQFVFPHERRRQTCIVDVGASFACHYTSTFIKMGAAAAGISEIWSDYNGPPQSSGSWLTGPHHELVKAVGGGQSILDYIDPLAIVQDLMTLVLQYKYPWLVLHLNDPGKAYEVASLMASANMELPLLLTFTGPSGVLVERTTASNAVAQIEPIKNHPVTVAGPCTELAMITAGAVLCEAMIGLRLGALPRFSLLYSLQRRRRIDFLTDLSLAELVMELSAHIKNASFAEKRGVLLGIGGLGNPAAITIALDHHSYVYDTSEIDCSEAKKKLLIIDADSEIALSNLNRQVLFSNQPTRGSKAKVAASVLQEIDHKGLYTGEVRHVKSHSDLEPLDTDYLLVMPDNDEARMIAADVAWNKGVVMASAATSATSGYAVVQQPDRTCLRCAVHLEQSMSELGRQESCSAVEEDAIIATNMVVAGVAVSELRAAMSGRPATNLQFHGTNVVGNCLARKASPAHCTHRVQAGSSDCSLAAT